MRNNEIRIGAILSYVQLFCTVIVGLVYTPVMIRLLGQNEYGLYNTIASTTSMLSVLNLGFTSGFLKYYVKYKNIGNSKKQSDLNGMFLTIFTVIALIALCCGIFLLLNLEIIFDKGLSNAEYEKSKILFFFLLIQLICFFPTCVFTSIIQANEKFVFSKVLNIFKTLISPLATLPLLLMGYKSIALVIVSFVVSIICDAVNIYYVFVILKERFTFGKVEVGIYKELFIYVVFIAMHLITDQINWNVDKILIGRFKGTSEVAVYSVGYSFYSYLITIGTPIATLFIPRVHKITANTEFTISQKKEQYTDIFISIGRIQFFLVSCIVTGFAFFGKQFIQLWVGNGYQNSYFVALLLMVPGTIDLIQVIATEIQRAQNKHKFRGIVYIVMAFVNVLISIPLCLIFGAIGSAIGTTVSLVLVQGIIINIYLHKKCNINVLLFWKNIFRISKGLVIPVAVGLLTVFIELNTWIMLVTGIIIYTTIFVCSMWKFSMNQHEKDEIKHIMIKLKILKQQYN